MSGNEEELDLNNKNITNIELKLLCKLKFEKLRELNLSHNNISDFEPIKNFNNLYSLDLSYNKIFEVNYLEEIVKNNKDIKIINLSNNKIKDIYILKRDLFPYDIDFYLDGNNLDIEEIKFIKIKKMAAKERIINEFQNLINDPLNNIGCKVYIPDKNNIFQWICTILGPKDTSYNGGLFYLKIYFPYNYPEKEPEIIFLTPIYHVNVNHHNMILNIRDGHRLGHISMSTLNWWRSEYTIRKILSDIFILFYLGNPESPYGIDRAEEMRNNRYLFEKKVKYFTRKYADPKNCKRKLYYDKFDFTYNEKE